MHIVYDVVKYFWHWFTSVCCQEFRVNVCWCYCCCYSRRLCCCCYCLRSLFVIFSYKSCWLRCCCFHSFHMFCCCSLSKSISLLFLVGYFQPKTHRTALVVIGVYTRNYTLLFLGYCSVSVCGVRYFTTFLFFFHRSTTSWNGIRICLLYSTKQKNLRGRDFNAIRFVGWDHSSIRRRQKKTIFFFWVKTFILVSTKNEID